MDEPVYNPLKHNKVSLGKQGISDKEHLSIQTRQENAYKTPNNLSEEDRSMFHSQKLQYTSIESDLIKQTTAKLLNKKVEPVEVESEEEDDMLDNIFQNGSPDEEEDKDDENSKLQLSEYISCSFRSACCT